jgi:hypothetical protein
MQCYKCKEFKPLEEYRIEIKDGKEYRKKYCKECHRNQSREWQKKNKIKSQPKDKEPKISPVIPLTTIPTENTLSTEFTPLELEIEVSKTNYRLCSSCNIEKPLKDYYKKDKIRCKQCQNILRRQREIDANDGTRWAVRAKPNDYYCDEQRDELFSFMRLMGWTFTDGVWHKDGLKDKDKNFYLDGIFVPFKEKKPGRPYNNGVVKRLFLDDEIPKIIEYRADNYTFEEIATIYDCSHTTIRRLIREHYEKQKQGAG